MSTIKFVKIYSQRGAARHKSGRKAPAFATWPSVFLHFAVLNGKKNLFCRTKKIFARSIYA